MGSLYPNKFQVRKVAIIGAGPSGLSAAKYLRAQGAVESIAIFEQQDEVGGVWNYKSVAPGQYPVPQQDPFYPPDEPVKPGSDRPDEAPIFPSPMYERLHANIPWTLMKFSDKKFPDDSWIFPRRETIQSYLVEYAEDIRSLIRFSSQVEKVTCEVVDGRDKWHLEARSTRTDQVYRGVFDAVVVANGHYSIPFTPQIANIAEFHKAHPSVITHSKHYRTPKPFRDQKVLVVGNGPSGVDIALQINEESRGPTLISVRHPTPPDKLAHMGCDEVPEIEEFLVEGQGVKFKDGRVETGIDAIVFCTGFLFSYHFLPGLQHKLVTTGRGVHGLYQHLFHIRHPTLVFPTLNMRSVPWPLSESQAAVFSAVWSNDLDLPAVEEMERWSKKLEEEEGEALHVFPIGEDGGYINRFHAWAMKARHLGKQPPWWDAEMFWQRSVFMEAKLRFEKQGCKATTLKELGLVYEPEPRKNRDSHL